MSKAQERRVAKSCENAQAFQQWAGDLLELSPPHRLLAILRRFRCGLSLAQVALFMDLPAEQCRNFLNRMRVGKQAEPMAYIDTAREDWKYVQTKQKRAGIYVRRKVGGGHDRRWILSDYAVKPS